MSVITAAVEVLQKSGTALHITEITEKIIAAGLWKLKGKNPAAIVSAWLYTDIKEKGDKSLFIKAGPGTFALNDGRVQPEDIALGLNEKAPIISFSHSGFSYAECARKVLEKFSVNKPMHYKEITEKALEQHWLVTGNKTPESTMYAQVVTVIKRQKKRGEVPCFVQHGHGYIGLSHWLKSGLALQIEQHNHQVGKALHEHLLSLKTDEFEELISMLLAEIGFEMMEVTKLPDGTLDVRGTLVVGDAVRTKMAVQVKRWKLKNNIQAPVVQQVRSSLGAHEQGLIITTSDFSKSAVSEAAQPDKTPIALMSGEQLVMLMMEHGIGVHRSAPDLFEIDEAFFVPNETAEKYQ
jgi:restriction system protein